MFSSCCNKMSELMLYFGSISYNSNTGIIGYDREHLYIFGFKSKNYIQISSPKLHYAFIFNDHDYVYAIDSNGVKVYSIDNGEKKFTLEKKNILSIAVTENCILIDGSIIMVHDDRTIRKLHIVDGGSYETYSWLHYSNGRLEILYKSRRGVFAYNNIKTVHALRGTLYFSNDKYHYRLIGDVVSEYHRLQNDSDVMSGGIIIRDETIHYLDPLSLEPILFDNLINSFDDYRYLLVQDENELNIVDPNYGFVVGSIKDLFVLEEYKFHNNYLQIGELIYLYSGLNVSSHKFCEYKDNCWYYNTNFPR